MQQIRKWKRTREERIQKFISTTATISMEDSSICDHFSQIFHLFVFYVFSSIASKLVNCVTWNFCRIIKLIIWNDENLIHIYITYSIQRTRYRELLNIRHFAISFFHPFLFTGIFHAYAIFPFHYSTLSSRHRCLFDNNVSFYNSLHVFCTFLSINNRISSESSFFFCFFFVRYVWSY